MGATVQPGLLWNILKKFQSTHPCGVRPTTDLITAKLVVFQSTHPCGVRPCPRFPSFLQSVSIHAPVWGATLYAGSIFSLMMFQSTHPCGVRLCAVGDAPSWRCFNPRTRVGCDLNRVKLLYLLACFNPRTREGCDDITCLVMEHLIKVSIHAPVWGATR